MAGVPTVSREAFIKMRGAWDTRHWIRVPSLSHDADGLQIVRYVEQLEGVRRVQVSMRSRKIRVAYDQTRVDYQRVLERLELAGFPASGNWWSRLKAGWFQYLDTTARDNAKAPPPPCCSNPRGVDGRGSPPGSSGRRG